MSSVSQLHYTAHNYILVLRYSTIKLTTRYGGTGVEPISAASALAGTRTQNSHIKFSTQESNLNFPFVLNEFLPNSNGISVVLYRLSYERIWAERVGFEPTGPQGAHKFSRLGRYDRFGTSPLMKVNYCFKVRNIVNFNHSCFLLQFFHGHFDR